MNYQDHLKIAQAIKDAQSAFAANDRLAYHAAFYNTANFIATTLEADNPDEFRRKVFMKVAGFDIIEDDNRVRRTLP